jgi:hypothetical protein
MVSPADGRAGCESGFTLLEPAVAELAREEAGRFEPTPLS